MIGKRQRLASIAESLAGRPLVEGRDRIGPDLRPILRPFLSEDDDCGFDWCAAFV